MEIIRTIKLPSSTILTFIHAIILDHILDHISTVHNVVPQNKFDHCFFQCPQSVTPNCHFTFDNPLYYTPLSTCVIHRFNATLPGLTFSDQYIQITHRLPSGHLYGLGEHNHKQFKHDMNWRNWTIFTRDIAPVVSSPNMTIMSVYCVLCVFLTVYIWGALILCEFLQFVLYLYRIYLE